MEEVWKIIYDSFEGGSSGAWKTVTASNSMRNELQFRLHSNIAKYKEESSDEVRDSIVADVQLCESLGYISRESSAKVLDILDKTR